MPKPLARAKLQIACLVVLLLIGLQPYLSQAPPLPYAKDELIEKFASFARPRNVPFLIFGMERGKPVAGHCTGPLVYASAQFIYGLIAEHCVSADDSFYPTHFTVRGERVQLLDYYRPPNEVRIWKIPNRFGEPAGRLVELAHGWFPGVRTFVMGYSRHLQEYEPFYTAGHIQTEPGLKLRYYGDFAHSASARSGFSGGGTYVYNESAKRFELLGITIAVTMYSLFTFAYSVPADLWEIIAQDVALASTAVPNPSSQPPDRGRFAFSNWETVPADVQAQWTLFYSANASYTLELEGRDWSVVVDNVKFGIGPFSTVWMDWAKDKLKVKGKLQEVDWSAYNWEARN